MCRSCGIALVAGLCLATPSAARGGGFEVTSQGTVALGRGGAYSARAADPMVLQYAPASLADAVDPEVLLSSHFVLYDPCVRRSGTYGDNVAAGATSVSRFGPIADYRDEPFPEVCRDGPVGITPNLLATIPLGPGWGAGFGLLTPAGAGGGSWGDEEAIVRNPAGEERPSPVRYLLAETDSALVSWSAGLGWRPHPMLALGITAHWAMAFSDSAAFVTFDPYEDPANDIRSEFTVSDLFIPGITATVKVTPVPGIEAVVGFYYLDDVRAGGESTLIFGEYATGRNEPGHTARVDNPIDDFTITTGGQTELWGSFRYAHLRPGAALPGRAGRDPMRDELFDVELTVRWELNSRVDAFHVDVPDGSSFDFTFYDTMRGELRQARGAPIEDRDIPKLWKDQLTLHLGGDAHVIPERLTLRAGASYETRGIEASNLSVDFMPLERLGLHGGATLRVGDLDVSVAYAHIFQETVTVGTGEAQYHALAASGTGPVVNAGRYAASYDVISAGLSYRFR